MQSPSNGLRACLSVPIPAIFDAARYLDAAVSAHMEKKKALAEELIHLADNPQSLNGRNPFGARAGHGRSRRDP